MWDPPCGPSCFKTTDGDRPGRTSREACPPALQIPLSARDGLRMDLAEDGLPLLTPGLMYVCPVAQLKKYHIMIPLVDVLNGENLKERCKSLAKTPEPTLEY